MLVQKKLETLKKNPTSRFERLRQYLNTAVRLLFQQLPAVRLKFLS